MRLTGIPRLPTTPMGLMPGRNPMRATRLPSPRLFTWRRAVATKAARIDVKPFGGTTSSRITGEGMGRYKP